MLEQLERHVAISIFDNGSDETDTTVNVHLVKVGKIVTAQIEAGGVTAVSATLGATEIIPVEFRPAKHILTPIKCTEDGVGQVGLFEVRLDGNIEFYQNVAGDAPLDGGESFTWETFSTSWIAAS